MNDGVITKTNAALLHRIVFKGGQQGLALVFGILLARILSPTEFGVVAIANIIIHYANNFTNFGLNNALVQKKNILQKHIDSVFTIDLAVSCLLVTLTIVFSDNIASFFHNQSVGPVLRWMSLYYIITAFYYIPVVILRRAIDFRFMTMVEFAEALLTSGVSLLLALSGFSYWSIVISTLSVPVLVTIIFIWKTRWIPRLSLSSDMQDLYSFGFWNFIRAQVQLLVAKIDYFVIGRYLSVTSLGIYEKSFELTDRAMTGLTMPVNGIFFSTFSQLQDDIPQVRQVFLEASSLLALICFPVLIGLAAVAPHFVGSCLGEKWLGSVLPIQILAISGMFRVQLGMIANVNVALGRYRRHTIYNIIVSVIFIGLCFLLVSSGIIAVCLAYFIYCTLSFLASFRVLSDHVHVGMISFLQSFWCPLAGALLMAAVVMGCRFFFFNNTFSFLQFIALVCIGCLIYIGWCFCFYRMGVVRFAIHGAMD